MPETLAVIFDMDGVLVDSYQPHGESWPRMAAEWGRELSEAKFLPTFGRTADSVSAARVVVNSLRELSSNRIVELIRHGGNPVRDRRNS